MKLGVYACATTRHHFIIKHKTGTSSALMRQGGHAMKIELRPLSKIKPYDNNPRTNDAAVSAVAESIRQFGFRQPVVVDTNGVIAVGHTR